jgi:hypothetical protein
MIPAPPPQTRWNPLEPVGSHCEQLGAVGTRLEPLGPVGTRWDWLEPVWRETIKNKIFYLGSILREKRKMFQINITSPAHHREKKY